MLSGVDAFFLRGATMKKILCSLTVAALVIVPSIVRSQTSSSMIGAGPHGNDWLIGTWSCTNSMPATAIGGPSNQTVVVTQIGDGAQLNHWSGTNYDFYSHSVYVPAKKMWVSTFIAPDGTYGGESTTQTGKTIVATGTAVDTTGKTTQMRDTQVYVGPTKYTDVGEALLAGTWKTDYKISCTKK
jgi:hypothetical protein